MNVYRGKQVWRTCSESENIFTDIKTTLGINFFEDCLLLASKHFFKPESHQIFSDTCYLITVTMHESNRPQALFFQQLSMWALPSFASLMLTFHLYFFLGFTPWHELPGNSLCLSQDIRALSLTLGQLCRLKTLWVCLSTGREALQQELHTTWLHSLLSSRQHLCCA